MKKDLQEENHKSHEELALELVVATLNAEEDNVTHYQVDLMNEEIINQISI